MIDRQKLIKQIQLIAETGCERFDCHDCLLSMHLICKQEADLHSMKFVAQGFLDGIAFEQGEFNKNHNLSQGRNDWG